MSRQYDNYINHFLDSKLDKSDTSGSSGSNTSEITPPNTPLIINKTFNYLSKQTIIKNIQTKQINKAIPEYIYNPPYHLLLTSDDILTNNNTNNINNTNISSTIETYINNLFNISKSNLKSNVHPDTIKAILVPYSQYGLKETGLGCASSYYQLYNRTTPIKKIILLCTNTIDTNHFISTSLTHITSYKNTNANKNNNAILKFDNITIEQLKPYLEINDENIQNEISLVNQLPFIETIAPHASIIPLLISNKIYLDNTNIDKINNIIYILKKILKNEDTILICSSNFTNTEINEELNNMDKETDKETYKDITKDIDIFKHCSIKKQDNTILQFIYDTVNGIKTRSSKIDDILFIQNTPSNSTMTMYIFSQLLNNYSGIVRNLSSSSSSISSNDSGISISSNKSNPILYSRITSYYTSIINKNINLNHFSTSQLLNTTIHNTTTNTSTNKMVSTSYIGLIFTSQPTIENNKSRVIENSFSEYEKISMIGFIKEEIYFNTSMNHMNHMNHINNSINNSIHKYNNISKIINAPINTPIFKSHLGVFITLYKNNKLRGCIGTSETNNDEYTIENNIKRFIIELTTKETKCRDLIFNPIMIDEINDITFNVNILYHMKSINIHNFHSNQFNFGYDGLLFKSILNDKKQCKYSLTSISKYFDNNINKDIFLNELFKIINGNINDYQEYNDTYKLFYNEGILINSY